MKHREFAVKLIAIWTAAAMLAAAPGAGTWRAEWERVDLPMFKACTVEMEQVRNSEIIKIMRKAANGSAAMLIQGCRQMIELGGSLTESIKRLDAECRKIDSLLCKREEGLR